MAILIASVALAVTGVARAGGLQGYDVGGPAFPSSSFDDPSVRPRLEVTFMSYHRDPGAEHDRACDSVCQPFLGRYARSLATDRGGTDAELRGNRAA